MTMGRLKSKKGTHTNHAPQKTKLRKDPGVPKLPDLKSKMKEKERLKAARENAMPSSPKVPPSLEQDKEMASEPTLSTLARLAAEAESSSNLDSSQFSTTNPQLRQNQKAFIRILNKVIDESDLVILVLDARDPEGCRSRLVEEEVLRRETEGKRLVFVLNKIDLVPKENAQSWLRYLRHTVPTLPFRCVSSTQTGTPIVSTAPALLKLLKAYRPSSSRSLTIGVVGYPNVGKSSLINALKKSKVCSTSSTPGHTKTLQSVQLERGIRVLDSPGVVWFDDIVDSKGVSKKGSLLLRNVVKVESIDDPIAVVEQILARTRASTLRDIYKLPPPEELLQQDENMENDDQENDRWKDTLEFLTMVALSSGRLLKGGTPDILSTARQVIQDWNNHKIPFWSKPPTLHPSMVPADGNEVVPGGENVGNAAIRTSFGEAFKLEGLFDSADSSALDNNLDVNMVEEDNDAPMDADTPNRDSDEMAVQDTFALSTLMTRKRRRSLSPGSSATTDPSASGILPNYVARQPKRQRRQVDRESSNTVVVNPLSRKMLKRDAKRARKAWRKAHSGTGEMDVDAATSLGGTFMV